MRTTRSAKFFVRSRKSFSSFCIPPSYFKPQGAARYSATVEGVMSKQKTETLKTESGKRR
jgi:hypothetical protein